MADKIKLSDIRAKFPMYKDVPDDQLLIGLRKKYYADIAPGDFYNKIDFDTQRIDPTEGMSTMDKLAAGFGKSAVDLGRSAKRLANMVGIGDYTEDKAKEDARLDQSLMNTTAGQVGNIAGDIALTAVPGFRAQQAITKGVQAGSRVLPKALGAVARGAAPYIGSAGSGAAIGAALTPEDMGEGATFGAVAGGLGEGLGRVGAAAYNGAKAVLDPLSEQGRQRILKRTMERFAQDPSKVASGLANPEVFVPGVTPTLAEATGDVGLAQLQRGAASASPNVATALDTARKSQVAGYRNALNSIAGDDAARTAAVAARDDAANVLYGNAFNADAMRRGVAGMQNQAAAPFAGVGVQSAAQDLASPELRALMQRPMFGQAVEQAKVLAANKGVNIGNPIESLQGLHYIKLALDDMTQPGSATALGRNANAAANELRGLLSGELEKVSPTYQSARQVYSDMSRPINQMDIAAALRDKAMPALTDFTPELARTNANAYAGALRNADDFAAKTTGFKGAKMADIMDPAQMQTLEGIGKDMGRYAAAQEAARIPGSPTAQNLGAQNILRQFMGPLGLPQSAADSAVGRTASGLLGLPFKATQSKTEDLLGQALTDPAVARRIWNTVDPKTLADRLQPYSAQFAIQAENF